MRLVIMGSQVTTQSRDRTGFFLLWGAALLLFLINLGGVPLRDWDEGTVAQVAREISRGEGWSAWFYPQLWGQPYLNKPPLLHGLIAGAFQLWGVHTWTARLPGAFLTATSVPMLYLLGREIFPTRLPALMGAGVYLMLLPVVRHGRLAMLDGTVVFFFIALLWLLLRSRRHRAWYLGVGLCFTLMCLTKGILGLLLLLVALVFLAWDAPRELRSPYLWGGLLLGSLPVVGWYLLQWQNYGQSFVEVSLVDQNFGRIWADIDNNQGPAWYYLVELLEYSWPWLIFWPTGLGLAWRQRSQPWSKLVLIWTGVYLLAISAMGTKLPWYIYPLYPAVALTIGAALAAAWNTCSQNEAGLALKRLPRAWVYLLALFSLVGGVGLVYASPWGSEPSAALTLTFLGVMVATGAAAVFLKRQNRSFVPALMGGLYIALLGFVGSESWVWEVNESFPVLPVASLITQQVPADGPLYMAYAYDRPALDFYADRRVVAQPLEVLVTEWGKTSPMYVLVEDPAPFLTGPPQGTDLGTAAGWHLVRH